MTAEERKRELRRVVTDKFLEVHEEGKLSPEVAEHALTWQIIDDLVDEIEEAKQ